MADTEYDLLIVGAGLTAATIVAAIREKRWKIAVVETRPHLGGNCFDYFLEGTWIHQYGPHTFHSPYPEVVAFLSKFTKWIPCNYSVTAEIEYQGVVLETPFPYCRRSVQVIGRELSEKEIIDCYFRLYSQKMWGILWDELPESIRARVPKYTEQEPQYFPNQFQALPATGYSRMIENMFDGAEIVLGADPDAWESISARLVVYTGRPDLIRIPGTAQTFAEEYDLHLDYRTIDICFASDPWPYETVSVNYCTLNRPYTRRTCYARLSGGKCRLVSTEYPKAALPGETAPYYPIPFLQNQKRLKSLHRVINNRISNIVFAGRLGTYSYLDMYQAVREAISISLFL
jgi:UDP-galactopyranose mutase